MKRRTRKSGYTLVEVMVALALMGVGVTGILGMQQAAVAANQRAQEITMATNVLRRWQERLHADALQWNAPSARKPTSDLGSDTTFLCAAEGCAGGTATVDQWMVPSGAGVGAGFDHFGTEISVGDSRVKYCVNVRYHWLRENARSIPGVLRAEVRVWWNREGYARTADLTNCGNTAAALAGLGARTDELHFVYGTALFSVNPS